MTITALAYLIALAVIVGMMAQGRGTAKGWPFCVAFLVTLGSGVALAVARL